MKLKTFLLLAAFCCGPLSAQVIEITDAWVRLSVPGQKATGGFMKITAKDGARLVGVTSPMAGVAEVHEMKMEGDVMKMRAVSGGLDLPAGRTVELKPGGYHLMLMDLKAPLAKGSTVVLSLVFKDAKGAQKTVELRAPVVASAPAARADEKPAMPGHQH